MQNVIVTGATHGIGQAIAQALCSHYRVIIIDQDIPTHTFFERFYRCDLSQSEALLETINQIKNEFTTFYALINNAGIFTHQPLEMQSVQMWQKIIAVNLTAPYSASKGGIVSLTHALALSLSGKVSVNSISPGWINTDALYEPTAAEHAWHPSGRVGKPSDIAEVVSFLLERHDGFITGSDFVVDGGVSKKMVYP